MGGEKCLLNFICLTLSWTDKKNDTIKRDSINKMYFLLLLGHRLQCFLDLCCENKFDFIVLSATIFYS